MSQHSNQPEYTQLTNDEYSDLMTALGVACGEVGPPLYQATVIRLRDLWYKLATLDVHTTPHVWHTEAQLQAANDETCDALAPPTKLCTSSEYAAYVAYMYHLAPDAVVPYLPSAHDCIVILYYKTYTATIMVQYDGKVTWVAVDSDV